MKIHYFKQTGQFNFGRDRIYLQPGKADNAIRQLTGRASFEQYHLEALKELGHTLVEVDAPKVRKRTCDCGVLSGKYRAGTPHAITCDINKRV